LETRALIHFIAVAEEKNIGRAALRLHVSQPALTRHIHELEDEVGAPLFTRTSTGMEITPAGSALLRRARTIQAELTQAKFDVKQADCQERRTFDINVHGSAIFNFVPRILSEFSKRNPDVELRLHNARKDQQVTLLRQCKIQIAFDRFLPREPDLAYELVHLEPRLQVALHKDHPLAAREVIHIGELTDEPFIGANFDAEMASKLHENDDSPLVVRHRADNILVALMLVSRGLGVTFGPPSIPMPNVVYRPCPERPSISINILCMYRKDDHSTLLMDMLETIREFRSAPDDEAS
jgi:DNA-binding transcriptional LysR family regulator